METELIGVTTQPCLITTPVGQQVPGVSIQMECRVLPGGQRLPPTRVLCTLQGLPALLRALQAAAGQAASVQSLPDQKQ